MGKCLCDLADGVSRLSNHRRVHVAAAREEVQPLRQGAERLLQSRSGGIKIAQCGGVLDL